MPLSGPAFELGSVRGAQRQDEVPEAAVVGSGDRLPGAARLVAGDVQDDRPGDRRRVAADLRTQPVQHGAAADGVVDIAARHDAGLA
jgi:hypothetical protein